MKLITLKKAVFSGVTRSSALLMDCDGVGYRIEISDDNARYLAFILSQHLNFLNCSSPQERAELKPRL